MNNSDDINKKQYGVFTYIKMKFDFISIVGERIS